MDLYHMSPKLWLNYYSKTQYLVLLTYYIELA